MSGVRNGGWLSTPKRPKLYTFDLQDHQNGKPGLGHITECAITSEVAKVQWANGKDGWYHIGASGKCDLYLIGGMSKINFF